MLKLKPMPWTAALALLLAGTAARVDAQTAPPEVTQYTEKASTARPPVDNRFMANISAGTTLNGGNTRSYGANVGGRFQLNRRIHQLSADALLNWAKALNVATDEMEPTAENIVGKLRYDVFVAQKDALFAALAPRRDTFAGLDARLQMQAGYLRNVYAPADNHRVWFEVGYDLTYDNLEKWKGPGPKPADYENIYVHSGRGFVGYTNLLTPLATLNLGLEFLYDFEHSDNNRVTTLVELTSSLSARFKLSVLSRILYDQTPVDGKEKTDYITTAQLVFTFDTYTPPAACPACDCSGEVAAARASCHSAISPADAVPAPEDASAPPAPLPAQPTSPAAAQPATQAPR
jgi:putative salt-induced outer membrane protein YdiY